MIPLILICLVILTVLFGIIPLSVAWVVMIVTRYLTGRK